MTESTLFVLIALAVVMAGIVVWVLRQRREAQVAGSQTAISSRLAPSVQGDGFGSIERAMVAEPPAIIVTPVESLDLSQGRQLPLPVARRLSPVAERLPALYANSKALRDGARLAKQKVYEVIIRKELQDGIKDGALALMNSKEVDGASRLNVVLKAGQKWKEYRGGQVVGQGNIKEVMLELPKTAQLLSIGFQAATYVTAQVHLAEISAKLGQIETTTRDIIKHLEEAQAGKLLGAMGRLKEISTRLQQGLVEVDEVGRLHHQIDDIDLQAAQIAEALKKELVRRQQDVQDARVARAILDGGKSEAERMVDLGQRYSEALERYQMALWVRLAAANVKALLPGDPSPCALRRAEVESAKAELERRHRETSERLTALIHEANDWITRSHKVAAVREQHVERLEEAHAAPRQAWQDMSRLLTEGERTVSERDRLLAQDVRLHVSLNDVGKIEEAYVLDPNVTQEEVAS